MKLRGEEVSSLTHLDWAQLQERLLPALMCVQGRGGGRPLGILQLSAGFKHRRWSDDPVGSPRRLVLSSWNQPLPPAPPNPVSFASGTFFPRTTRESFPAVFTEAETRRSCSSLRPEERVNLLQPTPLKLGSEEGFKVCLVVLAVFSAPFRSLVFILIGFLFFFFNFSLLATNA